MRLGIFFCIVTTLFFNDLYAQEKSGVFPAIIPLPAETIPANGKFDINDLTVIVCPDSIRPAMDLLNTYITAQNGRSLLIKTEAPPLNYIHIKMSDAAELPQEAYRLRVAADRIELNASGIAGIIYGIQTLRQLWSEGKKSSLTVPACLINDRPRFAYRGMALDVSRHLFPLSFIKKYIDLLALYKFNTFHWHLTDDQGWRIEIQKYPALQSVAAWREGTLIGHKKELPHRFDGKRYGGYYTQAEMKEIVNYAAQRSITVIPEIEMPGHALAALAAYPSLGCTGGPYKTARFWGIFDDVFCAGNDSVFSFLENVLDEVITIFPAAYIHIGGDETVKTKWKACAKCQQRIKDHGLKDEHDLQSYFIQRIEKYLNNKGRKIIGWDEILEGGLAPNATVMSWRGEEGGIAAAKEKHQVIMTPESHLYFDYYQSLSKQEPLAGGGYNPLSKVYGYEPAGEQADKSVKEYIIGVEGQAWSEYFETTAKAEYMLFPRAMALAELAWTPAALRNYPNFLERLRRQQSLLAKMNLRAAKVFDEIRYRSTVAGKGELNLILETSLPAASIHYTTDGSKPTAGSPVYNKAIVIKKNTTLRAGIFTKQGSLNGSLFEQALIVHKAIGSTVSLRHQPVARFNPGASAIVNGITASNRYNDGQWLGFSGDDLEAIIDLGSIQSVSKISMNFLRYHWQRMWEPVKLDIYSATDTSSFQKLYTQTRFPVNGINEVNASFTARPTRYIKIVAVNKGIIPRGEYGEGNKALLLLDEVKVQ